MKLTLLFVIAVISSGTSKNVTFNAFYEPVSQVFGVINMIQTIKSWYDDINNKIFGNISQEDRVMKILQEVGRISNKLEQIEMNVSMFCESFVLRSVQNVSCVIKTKISSIFR